MAETYNTLASVIQFNDKNVEDLGITDLLQDAPLLQALNTVPASNGTQHKYFKEVTASTAGFRNPLDGVSLTASQDEVVSLDLKLIDASYDTDVALADAYKDGRAAWLQLELGRKMKSVMVMLEKQVLYGTGNNAAGFAGLADNALLNNIADSMVIAPATAGSTANSQTSVFFLRHDDSNVSFILGNSGNFVVEEEPTIVQKQGSVTGTYPALYVPVHGWGGFQYGGIYSAGRIANIESSLTDDDIAEGLSLFPSSRMPNVIVMNRKALKLLRNSRTATNPTGAPAPFPVEAFGIPIIVTDSVSNAEAVVA